MPHLRLALLLAPLLSGCLVEQTYLVEARDLRAAQRLDDKSLHAAAVPALRADDGEPVMLRAPFLPPVAPGDELPDDARLAVRTRAVNARLTTGTVLAVAGAAFAAAAIGVFFQANRDFRRCGSASWTCQLDLDMSQGLGAALSLAAAAHIISGSSIVTDAAGRRPQEQLGPPLLPPDAAPGPSEALRPPPARVARFSLAF